MLLNIDFSTPVWLVNYYHVFGTISLILNCYALFLILFKSEKLDNFKYYLLAFQASCLLVDVHLTLLMQPQSLHPIPAGFCTGALARNNWLSCHFLMMSIAGLIGVQLSSLVVCFFRKFLSIKKLEKDETALWIKVVVVVSLASVPFYFVFIFSFMGNSCDKEFQMIRSKYPEYEESFRSLKNFSLYQLNVYWFLLLFGVLVYGFWAGIIVAYCTKRIYEILGNLKSSMSVATHQKHKIAIRSLVAQLACNAIGIFPPVVLGATLIVEFRYAQFVCRVLLMIFSTHSSVNAVVLVITTPPFRKFTFCWWARKTTPIVVSTAGH